MRVLLSEASSLTAREVLGVLGRRGVHVEAVTSVRWPISRFSRWCRRLHPVPAASSDPVGYLRAVDALMAGGRFDALLPTHEQTWLLAAGRSLLPHTRVAVPADRAFEQLTSKVAAARTLDGLHLPQPEWRPVRGEADLDELGYPVWVKAAYSTAGRGVRRVRDHSEAVAAWHALSPTGEVMLQRPAPGTYAQVQGVFADGRLVAAAASEQLAVGAGGSAAARVSVDHPEAVAVLRHLGGHLAWHGGLTLDYLHVDGHPSVIEANARMVEPGNAAAAGVDLPDLLLTLSTGGRLPSGPAIARPGVRTRSTLAVVLGAAERQGTRRAVLDALARSLAGRPPLERTAEVLTPVLHDPPSALPVGVAVAAVLLRPAAVARLAGGAVAAYGVPPQAVAEVRRR